MSTTTPPRFADIDGDGFYDLVNVSPSSFGFGGALGFGNGTGYGFGDDTRSKPYRNVMNVFSPNFNDPDPLTDGGVPQDFGFALVDVDGDGLVDLVRNHWQRSAGTITPLPTGGGEVLLNTGTTWVAVDGPKKWQLAVGAGRIPAAVPSDTTSAAGSAFVDLDGDGLQDLIQEEEGDSNLAPGAWLNPYARPTITGFPTGFPTNDPSGFAVATTVSYVSTSSKLGAKLLCGRRLDGHEHEAIGVRPERRIDRPYARSKWYGSAEHDDIQVSFSTARFVRPRTSWVSPDRGIRSGFPSPDRHHVRASVSLHGDANRDGQVSARRSASASDEQDDDGLL